MGSASRLRHFKRSRNPAKARSLDVREGIQHGGTAVEIRRHPPACVLLSQRIEANVLQSAQMFSDDGRSKRQETSTSHVRTLAPTTGDGGYPSGSTVP